MAKYAVVNVDGVVTNIIAWNPDKQLGYWNPQGLVEVTNEQDVQIGDEFDGADFTRKFDLNLLKTQRGQSINKEFLSYKDSVFINMADYESIRVIALAGIAKIAEASTRLEVDDVTTETLGAMQTRVKELLP